MLAPPRPKTTSCAPGRNELSMVMGWLLVLEVGRQDKRSIELKSIILFVNVVAVVLVVLFRFVVVENNEKEIIRFVVIKNKEYGRARKIGRGTFAKV